MSQTPSGSKSATKGTSSIPRQHKATTGVSTAKTSLKYLQQQQVLENNEEETAMFKRPGKSDEVFFDISNFPTELDSEITTNYEVQIKTDMYVSSAERDDKIQRMNIIELSEYLTGHRANVAHEEIRSEDQHIRFFIDLDKVEYCTQYTDFSEFIKCFVKLFIETVAETPGAEIASEGGITFDEIIKGARVAIKPGNPGGVHIYFTNIITYMVTFKEFKNIIPKVIEKGKLLPELATLFSKIDDGLYTRRFPILRTIHALKTYDDRCKEIGCSVIHKKDTPCKHEQAKIYLPQSDYDFSDYFFTYVPKEVTGKCLHIELSLTAPKPFMPVNTTVKQSNPCKVLSRIQELLNMIVSDVYSVYFDVISAMTTIALRTNKQEECRKIFDNWFNQNQSHKSKRKPDYDWDRLINSTSQRRYGENRLRELAEQSDPEGYKEWGNKYLYSEFKSLIANFIQADAAKYFGKMNADHCIYKSNNWFIFNEVTKLWVKSDKVGTLLNKIYDFFKSQFDELVQVDDERRIEIEKQLKDLGVTVQKRKNRIEFIGDSNSEEVEQLCDEYSKVLDSLSLIKHVNEEIGKVHFQEGMVRFLTGILGNDQIEFDSLRHIIPFQNGVLDLMSGQFRDTAKEDYLTVCNPYKYKKADVDKIQKCKDNIATMVGMDNLEEWLKWLGYCMTGETTNHNLMFTIGTQGNEGKNTIAKIYQACLPIHFKPAAKNVFAKGNSKFHKQAIHWGPPTRFIFIDEFERDCLDVDNLKNAGNGYLDGVEVMFGTSTDITLHAKFYMTSNHEPKFKVDNGIKKRGLYHQMTHRFVLEDEYTEQMKNDPNISIADPTWNSESGDFLFRDVEWKLAFIDMLLPYAISFYKSGMYLKNMRDNFVNYCIDNDKWLQFKTENLITTGDDNDRITKQDLADEFTRITGIQVSEQTALSEGKRIGLRYERTWRQNNLSSRIRGTGESQKGVFVGVQFKTTINFPRNTIDPTINNE